MRLLGSVRPLEEDSGVGPEFVDHLPAGTTGRTRNSSIVGDGDRFDFDLGTEFCDGSKDRRPFGAIRHAVGSILDITSAEDCSVRKEDRSSDSEVRVWGMSVFHHSSGSLFQRLANRRG